MAAKTGYYVTATDTAPALAEANKSYEGYKTWRQLYGAVDLNAQRQMSQLTKAYDTGISEAYRDAYKAKQDIANSTYFDTFKQQMTADVDAALSNAYNSYLQNYASGAVEIEENAASQRDIITQALRTRAENTANMTNKVYDFMKEKVDAYLEAWDDDTRREALLAKGIDLDSPEWSRFITTDEATNMLRTKTWAELEAGDNNTAPFFDTEASGDTRLSKAGLDFYDFMLNNPYYSDSESFDSWLRANDRDLYDWYTSSDPYNYAPGKRGEATNATSFRQFLGLEPGDEQYAASERKGGITTTQIQAKAKEIEALKDAASLISTRDELNSLKEKGYLDDSTYNALMNSVKNAESVVYESYVQAAGVTVGNSPTIKFRNGTNGILKNDNTTVTIGKQETAADAAKSFKRGQAFLYNGKPYLSDGQGHMYHVRNYAGNGAYEKLQKLLANTVYDLSE